MNSIEYYLKLDFFVVFHIFNVFHWIFQIEIANELHIQDSFIQIIICISKIIIKWISIWVLDMIINQRMLKKSYKLRIIKINTLKSFWKLRLYQENEFIELIFKFFIDVVFVLSRKSLYNCFFYFYRKK